MLPDAPDTSWQLVARGLQLKIWAMWILFSVPPAAGLLWAKSYNPLWLVIALLAIALVVDCIGRMFCMRGQVVVSRQLTISTWVQIWAILAALSLLFMGHNPWLLGVEVLLVLCFGQLVASTTFTGYLTQLVHALNRPDLMENATTLFKTIPTSVVSFSALVFVGLGTTVGFLMFWYTWFHSLAMPVLMSGIMMATPVFIVWLISTVKLFTNYGILIGRLRDAILFGVDR